MSRGKRYETEPKLNIKKVIAVIVALIVMIMFIVAIKNLIQSDSSANHLVSTTYFLINQNNKWGVMDHNAKIIIEPTYEEAIIIPNSKKDIFICTYDVNYEDNTYHTKVLNAKNKEIFKEYDKVDALENYDKNHTLWYENNVLRVEKNGKYGLINFSGDQILDTHFDQIETLKGVKNSFITVQDGKKGLVNGAGKQIIENQYEDIQSLGENTQAYIVKEKNQYGVYHILDCKYSEIKPLDNEEVFCVKEGKTAKVINASGKEVFTEKFDSIESIQDNIIVYQKNKKYYAYDLTNKKKLKQSYQELKYTADQLFIAKSDSAYGIIDIDGTTKVPQNYTNITYYQDANMYELQEKDGSTVNTILNHQLEEIAKGIVNEVNAEKSYMRIWTENGYEYYDLSGVKKNATDILTQNNLFLSKQNGKYGFVDKQGSVVVDYLYDDATEQNEFGYIAVKKDGLWGCLDKKGNVLCPTQYNLENNLCIDFVGEYHLGEDLNLNYYTNKK